MTWIPTYTGRRFSLVEPDPADVNIEDIAHGLSNLCRYTGQPRFFYSVAEHALRCSEQFDDDELAFEALMHDAHEAYVGDCSRGMKQSMRTHVSDPMDPCTFDAVERRIDACIRHTYGMKPVIPSAVHRVDMRICRNEQAALFPQFDGTQWTGADDKYPPLTDCLIAGLVPVRAKFDFLDRFYALRGDGPLDRAVLPK